MSEQWRVERNETAAAIHGDSEWRLVKNDELQDADFFMRPDAQWFADYLNALEQKLVTATAALEWYAKDDELSVEMGILEPNHDRPARAALNSEEA